MKKIFLGVALSISISSYGLTVTEEFKREGKTFKRIELSTGTQSTKAESIEIYENHPNSTISGFVASRKKESKIAAESKEKAKKVGYALLHAECLDRFGGAILEDSEKVLESHNTSPLEEVTTLENGELQVTISNRADAKVEALCESGVFK